ncbi:MAG: DUF2909 domain-containing protein [Pseudomonadota bacterium]
MTPLKLAIYISFFAMIISLIAAAYFLVQDKGKEQSKRTLIALGARVACAVVLMCLLSYGIFSGQLRSHAPWSHAQPDSSSPPNTTNNHSMGTNSQAL